MSYRIFTNDELQQVYAQHPDPVIAVDNQFVIRFVNPSFTNIYIAEKNWVGRSARDLLFNLNGIDAIIDITSRDFSSGEYLMIIDNGQQHNILASAVQHIDSTGETFTYIFIRDITVLKKKENLLAFLNLATGELSPARDTQTALEKISRLIVPRFANWFSIDLLSGGKLSQLILKHEDPAMIVFAQKYRQDYPMDINGESVSAKVLRTGIPSIIKVITKEMVKGSVSNPVQLALIEKLNLQSLIVVAFYMKDTIAGIINFVSTKSGVYYDDYDLQFAQNFANHVGLALENAKSNESANIEIAQRKHIEIKLQVAQSHLQSALSSGLVGTWVRDIQKNLLFADESLSAMFGLPFMPEGCDPNIYQDMIVPESGELAQHMRDESMKTGSNYELEYQVHTPAGLRWFFARGKTEQNEQGVPVYFTGVMIDITERKKAELLQKENERLFRFLADAIAHKIWTSGPDGKATYYNKGWYDYSGVEGFDQLKRIVWDMLHPDDRAIAAVEFPKVIEAGGEIEMEQRLRRYDGMYRWHLTRMYPHRNEEGIIQLWVGTCTDIHEQKESEHRKDEFLAIASHELKTPLTAIKAYNQLMEKANPSSPLDGFIRSSAKGIHRLERLVSDLLDVTKISAGKIGYDIQAFNFKDLLLDSIANLNHNPTHKIILEPVQDILFTGDRIRLEQVLNNLLSNAIKYSPGADRVIVTCHVEKRNIIVSVKDFGIGIAAENLDKLFDRYYRIDKTAIHYEGLGLGLFISSEILRYHHGSFWIESEPGKGSTFFFRLPLPGEQPSFPVTRTNDYYKDEHLTIIVNSCAGRLEVDWTGYQDLASVKHGCMLMLEYLSKYPTDCIINDNRNVTGTWSEAAGWVGNVWFPLMEKAGLRYFAHILAITIFGQLSAKKSIDIMAGIITTQYFTDFESAKKWIEAVHR